MKIKSTKSWRRCLGMAAAALPLALMSSAASAGIINAGFFTKGTYSLVGSCGASCASVSLTGTGGLSGLDGYFGPSGVPDFTFSALLDVTAGRFGLSASGMPPNGGWHIEDAAGDSLHGSINGWAFGPPRGGVLARLKFGITGGTGLFDDISSGSGGSWAQFGRDDDFVDAGFLRLDGSSRSTTVPEPSTLLLFGVALAALACGSAARRRLTDARPEPA